MTKKRQARKKTRTQKANYGATENRRTCHSCGSSDSRIDCTRKTGRLTIRYRTCNACGVRRTTQEICSMP